MYDWQSYVVLVMTRVEKRCRTCEEKIRRKKKSKTGGEVENILNEYNRIVRVRRKSFKWSGQRQRDKEKVAIIRQVILNSL